ncbi:MAG TPA: molybdopterin molybdotransferase MoeA [Chryseolinea sp.]|nr:molybdopterin molybdotransferase MoeA [Chryseolinea sp.]
MVNVGEASSIVFKHLCVPAIETVSFDLAINKVLAETVVADRDLPPCDRVTMDGIAVQFSSWEQGRREFAVEGVQAAGAVRNGLKSSDNCLEVMTGAIMPDGTDAVVPYEHLEISNGTARIKEKVLKGQNIHTQGQDAKKGSSLLGAGMLLGAAEIAVLAAVGKRNVNVFAFPTTAVISSGDELVEIDAQPGMQQVRRSNSYAIEAAMKTLGWNATLHHLPDDKDKMVTAMKKIAETSKVIILSGGVSKGKFDYVPAVLEEIGVRKLFHRVNQRPGKPFWFGASDKGVTVFALPGNPVSTYMCFYRYIRPWILKSMKVDVALCSAVLAKDFKGPQGLTYFLQVNVKVENGKLMAYPDPGGGSGDFANLKNVTGFLELPEGRSSFESGEVFVYIPFRN